MKLQSFGESRTWGMNLNLIFLHLYNTVLSDEREETVLANCDAE